MTDGPTITFPCIEVEQPIGTFYIGAIDSRDLVKISFADQRRIIEGESPIEIVSGIQRELSKRRVKELHKYVDGVDATFPTGIILSVNSEHAKFDAAAGKMLLSNQDDIATIIDGQHRIAGLEGYDGSRPFKLNVVIFIDMAPEDQAIVFSTINLSQTKVNASLAIDLYELANTRSPQKTCHVIARALNRRSDSPFYEKIMILGAATGKPNESLTQAAFVGPLIPLISEDPLTDRNTLKAGGALRLLADAQIRPTKRIFRNMFIKREDEKIAQVMWSYFSAVAHRWPQAWNTKQKGQILNRTTGYRALMRFLPLAYLSIGYLDSPVPIGEFASVFSRARLQDPNFNAEEFVPGTGGQTKLFKQLCLETRVDESSAWKGSPKAAHGG